MPSLSAAIAASASGLNAERSRIEVAVSNLANAESTRSAEGTPYRRRDVVLTSNGVTTFEGTLHPATGAPARAGYRGNCSRSLSFQNLPVEVRGTAAMNS